jgi:hypothetical protein
MTAVLAAGRLSGKSWPTLVETGHAQAADVPTGLFRQGILPQLMQQVFHKGILPQLMQQVFHKGTTKIGAKICSNGPTPAARKVAMTTACGTG